MLVQLRKSLAMDLAQIIRGTVGLARIDCESRKKDRVCFPRSKIDGQIGENIFKAPK
jgi:hypothetical protein